MTAPAQPRDPSVAYDIIANLDPKHRAVLRTIAMGLEPHRAFAPQVDWLSKLGLIEYAREAQMRDDGTGKYVMTSVAGEAFVMLEPTVLVAGAQAILLVDQVDGQMDRMSAALRDGAMRGPSAPREARRPRTPRGGIGGPSPNEGRAHGTPVMGDRETNSQEHADDYPRDGRWDRKGGL